MPCRGRSREEDAPPLPFGKMPSVERIADPVVALYPISGTVRAEQARIGRVAKLVKSSAEGAMRTNSALRNAGGGVRYRTDRCRLAAFRSDELLDSIEGYRHSPPFPLTDFSGA